ncbi:MAG: hypothetical protein ACREB9_08850, partial [Thermoplasmata archaeon]
FTTHIMHEADMLCDRIAVVHKGKLLALSTAEELKHQHGGAREVSIVFATPLPAKLRAEVSSELQRQGAVLLAPEAGPDTLPSQISFRVERAEELLPWVSHWAQVHSLEIDRMAIEEATLEGAFLGMIGESGEEEPLEPEGPTSAARVLTRASGGGLP